MTLGRMETEDEGLVPASASPAMRRFWAEFQARAAAAHSTPARPALPACARTHAAEINGTGVQY
jgi:cytochrome c553